MRFKSIKRIALALALLGVGTGLPWAKAQAVQHQVIVQPGGMPGLPVVTGLTPATNGVNLIWDGPAGYYQVFEKSNGLNAPWVAVGKATNLTRNATITQLSQQAFFRVAGPAPKYAGSQVCITCHLNECSFETNTAHAHAFTDSKFAAAHGQNNAACLPCHTVGFGLPTGFTDTNNTPQLEGVQCENCHGPAARHAGAEDDPALRPRVEIAATMCGGCHSGATPTFEDWSASAHAVVVPDALRSMSASTNSINSCGACHSGSARLAFINGKNPAATVANDINVATTCAVCHDPHATNGSPAQLRNPLASTNDFHMRSADVATVTAFTNKYQASSQINLCAQCHNDRGASWQDTSYAPHHSLQYNFLLGSVGELFSGAAGFNPSPHAGLPTSAAVSISGTFYLTNQCAACHMEPETAGSSYHSHTFTPAFNVCLNCHATDPRQSSIPALSENISNDVALVVTELNLWAQIHNASTNGVVGWEYQHAGGLVWQSDASGTVTNWQKLDQVNFTGPKDQTTVPENIKKARFNLYLVLNDGSGGVHNPLFAEDLLNWAEILVLQELNK